MKQTGWHPNPDGSHSLRWWDADNQNWTDQTTPFEAIQPAPRQARLDRLRDKLQDEVGLARATYLGGIPSVRNRKLTGALLFQPDRCGLGITKPKLVSIPTGIIASVEIAGGEVAKRKVLAVAAFGVIGGLAARGAKDQTVVIIRMTDDVEAFFELDKISPQEVRAKLSPWLKKHGIPWREDDVRAGSQPPAPPVSSLADEITKLAALRDSGVLTAAEFDAAKARLLTGN